MKRKWLKVLMLATMAGASFGSAMNPKEIEDPMYVMNQATIEFTVPDKDDTGDGGKKGTHQETMNHLLEQWNEREDGRTSGLGICRS